MTKTDHDLPGLRERKKARTRAQIQEQALRLFEDRGYAGTTVDQIAEAADVSTTTFFRYFPSKEDTVAHNAFTPAFLAALHDQPRDAAPFEIVRQAVRDAAAQFDDQSWQRERRRQLLVLSVPDLRAASFEQLTTVATALRREVADRTGRHVQDPEVQTFIGAVLGIFAVVVVTAAQMTASNYADLLDAGLDHLSCGLPL